MRRDREELNNKVENGTACSMPEIGAQISPGRLENGNWKRNSLFRDIASVQQTLS